ncbi:hypothetical protein B0T22DRAFT_499980 [Podospora appendiculata]|uniref:Uncharacterized protein n=1 Tax=Podospora appendiculata TaxID=314037 RepID=A0AAE0X4P2_9PEZI|nr:hypothetical protein B0T22DRAFT_499980 [Podospora appendiculata]
MATARPPGSLRQLACLAPLRCSSSSSSSSSPLLLRFEVAKRQRALDGSDSLIIIAGGSRQCRFQSMSSGRRDKHSYNEDPSRDPKAPPPPRPSIARLIFTALWDSFKHPASAFRGQTLKKLFQQSPEELVLAIVVLAASVVLVVYIVRTYFTYFYSEEFTRYPQPIAKALRRALYYSNYQPDPRLALKYYKIALELCDELRLDPFSDDVMGIKIQLAAWLEKVGNYENAAAVLEALLGDCKRWVDVMEKSVKEGTVPMTLLPPAPLETDGSAPQVPNAVAEEVRETIWGKRTRVLGKAVGISVKLAAIYADEHLTKPELAHERLVWAVETALKELQRRSVEPLKEGEGDWMTPEQIGGALESLGHSYESKSQFQLALPLFFEALRLCQDQCHSAVLMNNIAICFAQHPVMGPGEAAVDAMMAPPSPSATPTERRASYLDAAQRWAKNANQHAAEPQGEQRTSECDEACAVSLCNLADIASLSGNPVEARQRFEQAIALSKRVGYAPGVTQAEAGLRALSKSSP